MSSEVIVCIVSGILTLAGTVVTCLVSNSKTMWRIEQLERKVEKHNNVIERVYKLEQKVEDL